MYKMKSINEEIKDLIGLNANMDEIIAEFTDYITDNYDRLKKEYIKELKQEYNME